MNPPVVPHPNICRAGVVTHITLVHLLHATICKRGQMNQICTFLKALTKITWHYEAKEQWHGGKALLRDDDGCQLVI